MQFTLQIIISNSILQKILFLKNPHSCNLCSQCVDKLSSHIRWTKLIWRLFRTIEFHGESSLTLSCVMTQSLPVPRGQLCLCVCSLFSLARRVRPEGKRSKALIKITTAFLDVEDVEALCHIYLVFCTREINKN